MITQEEQLVQELALWKHRACTDRLTGLGSGWAMDDLLDGCVAQGKAFAFVLFDMAKFKRANTLVGYDAANEMLRRIGGVLRKHRGDGHAFRQGGDEFLIVLPGASRADARRVRNRVERAAGVDVLSDGTECYIAGGIGSWEPSQQMEEQMLKGQRAMETRKTSYVAGVAV